MVEVGESNIPQNKVDLGNGSTSSAEKISGEKDISPQNESSEEDPQSKFRYLATMQEQLVMVKRGLCPRCKAYYMIMPDKEYCEKEGERQ